RICLLARVYMNSAVATMPQNSSRSAAMLKRQFDGNWKSGSIRLITASGGAGVPPVAHDVGWLFGSIVKAGRLPPDAWQEAVTAERPVLPYRLDSHTNG